MFRKIAIALTIASLVCASAAFAGKRTTGGGTTSIDKIKALGLTYTSTVAAGHTVKFTGSAQNLTKSSLSVPWVIKTETGVTVGSGTATIAGGTASADFATGSVTADWVSDGAAHTFTFQLDPANTLLESGTGLTNNAATVAVNTEVSPN